jgi:hypothetical protein
MRKTRNLRKGILCEFIFTLRAHPIPGDLRPEWRIPILLLIVLRVGRGAALSLKKAHLVNWAVRTKQAQETLLRMIEGDRRLDDIPVRFDPALNRAIDFAVAERLLDVDAKTTGSILSLSDSGKALARTIYDQEDVFITERHFLDRLRGRLPEPKVQELLEWETDL